MGGRNKKKAATGSVAEVPEQQTPANDLGSLPAMMPVLPRNRQSSAGSAGRAGASRAGSSYPPGEPVITSGAQALAPPPAGRSPQLVPRPPPAAVLPTSTTSASAASRASTRDPFGANLTVGASSSRSTTSSKQQEPGTSGKFERPVRGSSGQGGVALQVRTNHFRVTVVMPNKQDVKLNQYHVVVSPEMKSRGFCRVLMKSHWESEGWRWEDRPHAAAYDGRSILFTADPADAKRLPITFKIPVPRKLKPGEEEEAPADLENGLRTFSIHVDHKRELDFSNLNDLTRFDVSQACVQALDVVFREGLLGRCTAIGRSLFDRSRTPDELGRRIGIEAATGFFQSIRPTQQGLSLNVDFCAIPVWKSLPVLEFLRELAPGSVPADSVRYGKERWRQAEEVLKGRSVRAIHREGRRPRYLVRGLSEGPLSTLTFARSVQGGGEPTSVSVVDYFKELQLENRIEHYNYPCLDVGTADRPTYLHMEFCEIAKFQRVNVKGTKAEKQFRTLTSAKPSERREKITKIVAANRYNVAAFGMQVATDDTLVTARELESPELTFGGRGRTERPRAPRKGWNMVRRRFEHGGSVTTWACVALGLRGHDYRPTQVQKESFCLRVKAKCKELGMRFLADDGAFEQWPETDDVKGLEKFLLSKSSRLPNLLIVILPFKSPLYGELKRVCETVVGVMSQCCDARRAVDAPGDQYFANLALKINMKMGGRNAVLSLALKQQNTDARQGAGVHSRALIEGEDNLWEHVWKGEEAWILFGADVNHPSPELRKEGHMSVAAVVATQDWPGMASYAGSVRRQAGGQEKIENLEEMVSELLQSFRRRTERKPRHILFYRDGVGEGQFDAVLQHEKDAVVNAAGKYASGATLTFVVVQKRHHTRFFPVVDRNSDSEARLPCGNIPSGTVVDTQVCHPKDLDFYLCSHAAGLDACVRPAHYHLLWDENGFTSDTLQRLTYNLCYMYGRCTKPVSVVPPAFYAHHLATRGRHYMADGHNLPNLSERLKSTMFFC